MSPLATMVLAWAAVYGYVSTYAAMLYARRRSAREYLDFAVVCGGLCVYAAGHALLIDATTLEEASIAMRIAQAGPPVAIPFFVQLCHRLIAHKSRIVPVAHVWGAVGLALAVTGMLIDPTQAEPAARYGFPGAPDILEPRHTVAGALFVGLGIVPVGVTLARLGARGLRDTDTSLLFLATALNALAAIHDGAVRLGLLRSVYLAEHTSMASVVVVSYVLLDRFVCTSEALGDRTQELAARYQDLQKTQERLVRREQLAAVGELSAVIAHEVRNPLAVIKNAIAGLRRSKLRPQDRVTLLDILDEETDKLNRLMHDLLAYAQPIAPKASRIRVDEVVQRSVERAVSGSGDRSPVEVRYELHPSATHCFADPELLRHALVNVVENALQAMPDGGTLVVRTSPAHIDDVAAVAIAFEDTGEGMDTMVRARARNPFFTTRPKGTGLGLAIVERVVRTHAGRLEIQSKHGEGAKVIVTLPQHAPSGPTIPAFDPTREGRISGIREPA